MKIRGTPRWLVHPLFHSTEGNMVPYTRFAKEYAFQIGFGESLSQTPVNMIGARKFAMKHGQVYEIFIGPQLGRRY